MKNQSAFPRAISAGYINAEDPDAQYFERQYRGMTLRQYYAAAALTGIMSFTTQTDWVGEKNDLKDERPASTQVAELAFELSDAMIAFEENEKK